MSSAALKRASVSSSGLQKVSLPFSHRRGWTGCDKKLKMACHNCVRPMQPVPQSRAESRDHAAGGRPPQELSCNVNYIYCNDLRKLKKSTSEIGTVSALVVFRKSERGRVSGLLGEADRISDRRTFAKPLRVAERGERLSATRVVVFCAVRLFVNRTRKRRCPIRNPPRPAKSKRSRRSRVRPTRQSHHGSLQNFNPSVVK